MSIKTKILIAEHDPVDLELLHNELKKSGINYISETVKNETDYCNALKDFVPDLILADYTFPSFDGPSAFRLREQMAPDTPFIFVSGTVGEEKSIELIKTGVTDYALKDRMFTLSPKITRALKEAKVIQQKKLTEEQRTIDGLKLEQQNNELIKLHAELDHFVDSTTHDLRSPLNSILGVVNLIEEESKEQHTLELAKVIKQSVKRLNESITDILNYSQNNHTELTVEIIAIQKLTEEIVDSLHNAPGAKGITFKVIIDEQEPFYSDVRRISIVLQNLISNAINYHKQDVQGRFISVTGTSYEQHLNLCIEDNGIGIASIHHDNIFDMFFRLPSKVPGSGFGLYIVKETIRKLHGSIEVDSEKGSGTSFNIKIKNYLPSAVTT
jgi:signal transduction histidine kinase